MTHNFDAAIKEWELADKQWLQYDTILFALKFTKAALSGEVSDETIALAFPRWEPKPVALEVLRKEFKAICQQLAKEVGNG